jgi:hypothetical protein
MNIVAIEAKSVDIKRDFEKFKREMERAPRIIQRDSQCRKVRSFARCPLTLIDISSIRKKN